MLRTAVLLLICATASGYRVTVRSGDDALNSGLDFLTGATFNIYGSAICAECPRARPLSPISYMREGGPTDLDLNQVLRCGLVYGSACGEPLRLPGVEINIFEGTFTEVTGLCQDVDQDNECDNPAVSDPLNTSDDDGPPIVNFFIPRYCGASVFLDTARVFLPDMSRNRLPRIATVFSVLDRVSVTLAIRDPEYGTMTWRDENNVSRSGSTAVFIGTVQEVNNWLQNIDFDPSTGNEGRTQTVEITAQGAGRNPSVASQTFDIVLPIDGNQNRLVLQAGQTRDITQSANFDSLTCPANAILNIASGVTVTVDSIDVLACVINGPGTLTVTNTPSTTSCSGTLNNLVVNFAVSVATSSTCTFLGTNTISEPITVPATGTLNVRGTIRASPDRKTITVNSGGVADIRGTLDNVDLNNSNGGTARVTATSTFSNTRVAGPIRVTAPLTLTSALQRIPSAPSAVLNVVAGGAVTLSSGGIDNVDVNLNEGSLTSPTATVRGGQFTCAPGTVTVGTSNTLTFRGTSTPRLGNASSRRRCTLAGGGIIATEATGGCQFDDIVVNTPVEIRGGTCRMRYIDIASNARVQVNTGARNNLLTPGSSLGSGTYLSNGITELVSVSINPARKLRLPKYSAQQNQQFRIVTPYTVGVNGQQIINNGITLINEGTCSIAGQVNIKATGLHRVASPGTKAAPGCSFLSTYNGGTAVDDTGKVEVASTGSLSIPGALTYNYLFEAQQSSILDLAQSGNVVFTKTASFLGNTCIGCFSVQGQVINTGTDPISIRFCSNTYGRLNANTLNAATTGTPVKYINNLNYGPAQIGEAFPLITFTTRTGSISADQLQVNVAGVGPVSVVVTTDNNDTSGVVAANTPTTVVVPAVPVQPVAPATITTPAGFNPVITGTPTNNDDGDDSSSTAAAIAIPVSVGGLCCLAMLCAAVGYLLSRARNRDIDKDELYAQPRNYIPQQQQMVQQPLPMGQLPMGLPETTGWYPPVTTPDLAAQGFGATQFMGFP